MRIIAIVGESGTGKSTIAEYIERAYGVMLARSRTDRPKRSDDDTGHIFITRSEFDAIPKEDRIAYCEYGGYRYCTTPADLTKENTYVIDERGFNELCERFERAEFIGVRVLAREETVIARGTPSERIERDAGQFTLPYANFDHVIRNDSSLEDLYARVDEIMRAHGYEKA